MKMYNTEIGVWNFQTQQFIYFIPCEGEKRVRVDVHDSLENYAVFAGKYHGELFYCDQPPRALTEYQIDYS